MELYWFWLAFCVRTCMEVASPPAFTSYEACRVASAVEAGRIKIQEHVFTPWRWAARCERDDLLDVVTEVEAR